MEIQADGDSYIEEWFSQEISGERAYSMDLELEAITLQYPAFRCGGSKGADHAANWIHERMLSIGLESTKEEFEFTTWDLTSRASLQIEDGAHYGGDWITIESFQCEQLSWPTPEGGVTTDLVILPLPPAADYSHIGTKPIDIEAWDAVNTTDKVLVTGKEVRWIDGWEREFIQKLRNQPPAAVVFTWWYEWMNSSSVITYSSGGGRPLGQNGPYLWDLGIPLGTVNFQDGRMLIAGASMNLTSEIEIPSKIGTGEHINVVGSIQGHDLHGKILITAHYDTVMTPGFCDNGAGISGLLELARAFQNAVDQGIYLPEMSLEFVAFASEEMGMLGSINYMIQHASELGDVVAVINLDCIGSDRLVVTRTTILADPDIQGLVSESASDLEIPIQTTTPGGSDQECFRSPYWAEAILRTYWDIEAGIASVHPVESSCMLMSEPISLSQTSQLENGYIHTILDSSLSTSTLGWIEAEDLGDHINVAALAVVRISPSAYGEGGNSMAWIFVPMVVGAILLLSFLSKERIK